MTLLRLIAMRFFQSANLLGVVLTLYYRAHGLDYTAILSFEIVLSLAMAAATLPLGLWADRHGRVRALKCGNATLVVAAVVFLLSRAYWQFLLSDVLYGLAMAFQSGADTALLAPGGTRWLSRYAAAGAAAGLLSSLAAGFILQAAGSRWLVGLNVGMALLALLSVATAPDDSPSTAPVAGLRLRPVGEAARALVAAPWLVAWTVAGAVAFRLVAINLMFLDLPLWVDAGWHGAWLGLGVTILYGAGLANLLAPRVRTRLGARGALSLSQAGAGGAVLLVPLLRAPWALTAAMAAALALQSWQGPIVDGVVAPALPEPMRATALSLLDVPAIVVTIACELGVGALADVHLSLALWASGLAVLAVLPLWWVRARPRGDAQAAAG